MRKAWPVQLADLGATNALLTASTFRRLGNKLDTSLPRVPNGVVWTRLECAHAADLGNATQLLCATMIWIGRMLEAWKRR
ncbi:hypothetical protein RHGRI_019310 [Rhododendron griersonianum]|uniref:Uncharacterized protein n=1 Tax=Rhododendron griersonianum TaxID=479676 RepID=A0AAV6JGU0_9ERIC|nr:hypothetical protein RHGRI_019310 [Rhododendron griersonianum]